MTTETTRAPETQPEAPPPQAAISGDAVAGLSLAAPEVGRMTAVGRSSLVADAALPLFGEDEDTSAPSVDTFSNAQRVSLDAHSWAEHVPGWHSGPRSTFDELLKMARWEQRRRWMHSPRRSQALPGAAEAGRSSTTFRPVAGDLIVMGGRCHRDWRHCVPKQTTPIGPRISVNFAATSQFRPD